MIQLVNVSKVVNSGSEKLTILHALDLTLPSGQFVAVVGPSGSGKSTPLGLIAGLDAPTSGDITLVEYGVLGLLAGVIGSGASAALTWAMSTYGPRGIPWQLEPTVNLIGVGATLLLVIAVGCYRAGT